MADLKKLRIYEISLENIIDIEGLAGPDDEDTTQDVKEAPEVPTPDIPVPSPEFP